MPTRPMDVGQRTVKRRITSGDDRVAIDVSQARNDRTAKGTFRLTQKASGITFEMTALGQLQTAKDWASFTGRARLRRSEPERSVTIILDGSELVVSAGDFHFTATARR